MEHRITKDEEIRLLKERIRELEKSNTERKKTEEELERTNKELEKTNEELNEIKNALEEKVSERTKELNKKLQDLDKSNSAMLSMIEDLNETSTELRETQDELLHKERLATLGQFSGNISHELRNPLGVIDSSTYYLKMRLKDQDEKVQLHLNRINLSVDKATSIIQSLLNLTRMQSPALKKEILQLIVTESITTSKIPSAVKLKENYFDKEIHIQAEREQIRIAFKNIITNAVDAMDGKGTLSITAQKLNENHVEVIFSDTGCGIAPENMDKVFQPLFSTKANGIGFGLSITKMIIENHEGTLRVESEQGKDTKFIVGLPLK